MFVIVCMVTHGYSWLLMVSGCLNNICNKFEKKATRGHWVSQVLQKGNVIISGAAKARLLKRVWLLMVTRSFSWLLMVSSCLNNRYNKLKKRATRGHWVPQVLQKGNFIISGAAQVGEAGDRWATNYITACKSKGFDINWIKLFLVIEIGHIHKRAVSLVFYL